MKRVLVTGATGFVGRQTLTPLVERGYDVHAVSRRGRAAEPKGSAVRYHAGDLLHPDGARAIIAHVEPTHLLHLAWEVEPGRFWTADENLDWVAASLRLYRAFRAAGGRRLVTAGSCAEYDWSQTTLSEGATPLVPATLYGSAKLALSELQSAYARQWRLSAAWGRIFFVYGPHEDPRRLVSSVVFNLLRGEPAETTEGLQRRDFLSSEDLGEAFAALLDSDATGAVNLARGEVCSIRSVVETIGELTGRSDLLRIGARPGSPSDPAELAADVGRLRNDVGWRPRRSLREGLEATVAWWREQLTAAP